MFFTYKYFNRIIESIELRLCKFLPDKAYLSFLYKLYMGKSINWEKPKSYNEKLNWLKIYYRNPLYTTLVDKLSVKQYVLDKVGGRYIIPTLQVYDNVKDIDIDKLPDQFVLKTTHSGDSLGVVICRDKSKFDL